MDFPSCLAVDYNPGSHSDFDLDFDSNFDLDLGFGFDPNFVDFDFVHLDGFPLTLMKEVEAGYSFSLAFWVEEVLHFETLQFFDNFVVDDNFAIQVTLVFDSLVEVVVVVVQAD